MLPSNTSGALSVKGWIRCKNCASFRRKKGGGGECFFCKKIKKLYPAEVQAKWLLPGEQLPLDLEMNK